MNEKLSEETNKRFTTKYNKHVRSVFARLRQSDVTTDRQWRLVKHGPHLADLIVGTLKVKP